MFENKSHIINSEKFEFETDDKDKAFEIQKKLRSILENSLSDTTEKICSKYSLDELFVIDKIEMDLGDLDLENLEIELNKKFESEFEIKIAKALKEATPHQKELKHKIEDSNLELIKYFLHYGHLPWWVDIKEQLNIDEIFLELLLVKTDEVLSIFKDESHRERVTKRFVNQFEPSTFESFYKQIKKTLRHELSNYLEELEITLETLRESISSRINIELIKLGSALFYLSDEKEANQSHYTKSKSFEKIIETILVYSNLEISELMFILNKAVNENINSLKESRISVEFLKLLFSMIVKKIESQKDLSNDIKDTLRRLEMGDTSDDNSLSYREYLKITEENFDMDESETEEIILDKTRSEGIKKFKEIEDSETDELLDTDKKDLLKSTSEKIIEDTEKEAKAVKITVDDIVESTIREDFSAPSAKAETLAEVIGKGESDETKKIEITEKKGKTKKIEKIKRTGKTERKVKSDTVELTKEIKQRPKDFQTKKLEESIIEDSAELSEPMFIDNAGLVLISPFLPRFFEKLDLTNENIFKDNSLRERAIKLLQYLITGKSEIFEYDIALNKIICGMDINQTIKKEFEITDEEKENCESLLKSVIEHWTALKNTSVKGLRESFLLRRGKLQENENQWNINVEHKTFDVLLDTIPWSFSIIKLNWMNKPVYVEWR